jgi:NAD(P)-dependent dehydrogenase (short-subunit alcohol dehydrogenase family)
LDVRATPLIGVGMDKTAFVTGATGGIGKQIALGLARTGAHVILGARDLARGRAAQAELAAASGSSNITVAQVDVSSQKSIAALELGVSRLDILVNNAGAWFSDRCTSIDGHELTFATNVLGPHLLTRKLLPLLEASSAARVINIVSGLAANYDATDLEFAQRKYDGFKAYAQSKQALRMLTWGQAARLARAQITVNAVAPGFVRTEFNRNAHGFTAGMINVMAKLFAVTPAKGADTAIWAATSAELAGVTGKLFEKRKEKADKFGDVAAIADLERRCDELATSRSLAA